MLTDEKINTILNRKRPVKQNTYVSKSEYEDFQGNLKPFKVSVSGEGIDDCRLQFVQTRVFLELLERITACTFDDSTASTGTTTLKFEDSSEYLVTRVVTSTDEIIHCKTETKDIVILRATEYYFSRLIMEEQNGLS